MTMTARILASLCALTFAGASAHAQFYKLHNADVSGSAIGQFTTPLTSNYTGVTQGTSDSFGGLFTITDHPVAFAGIELNYGFTDFSEYYNASDFRARVKTDMHEATAAYIFHPHFRHYQPFVAIGGGGIDFVPSTGDSQWRAAGLVEAGFDIPTSNPHFGFRVKGRSLIYRDPNFGQYSVGLGAPSIGSKTYVVTNEPTVGAYFRF